MILGKAKWEKEKHKTWIKKLRKLEGYSKVAQGTSRKDHTISIRNDENGVSFFNNACTNCSIEFRCLKSEIGRAIS